jgi:hypothetical protein
VFKGAPVTLLDTARRAKAGAWSFEPWLKNAPSSLV